VPTIVERWLRLAAARVQAQRIVLSDLDAAIGDGDHGYNLARGFTAIVARFDSGDADFVPGRTRSLT
jgi:phosphoenolpyruvate---glycerone phosphotransferase subunit DhaL